MDKRIGGGAGSTPPPPPPPTRLINEGVEIIKPQTEKIMDKRIGAGGIFAIIVGIITLGGVISIGMMKRAVGTVLIMLVGIYAVSNIKGDFFGMIKDFGARSEASEIRRLEFEREKMKLEAETQLKTLELEAKRTEAERLSKERERVRSERAAAQLAKQESDLALQAQASKVLVDGGFSFLEKNNIQEIHYKMIPSQYSYSGKVVAMNAIISRNELATSSKGLKWRSQRFNLEYHCTTNLSRVSNIMVYDGPLTSGNLVTTQEHATEWAEPKQWHRVATAKWCSML